MAQPALLLTRPKAQAEAFAALVREQVHHPVETLISPLLQIAPTLPATIPEASVLIFTSLNGVAEYTALRPSGGRVAYCVGERTAEAARALGYDARVAGRDAETLVRYVRDQSPSGALLHPCGRHRRGDVAARLRQSGIDVGELVVYDQVEQHLTDAALVVLASDRPVIVPLFSPRTATLFSNQIARGHNARVICMSAAVRAALTRDFIDIQVVSEPTGAKMLSAVLGGILGGLSP